MSHQSPRHEPIQCISRYTSVAVGGRDCETSYILRPRAKDSGRLRDTIARTVQEVKSDMETAVHAQVAQVVTLIGSLTDKSEMQDDEQEQQQAA